jgi:ethanolamine utilization protein EutA (predicted chaperonin)
VKKRSKNLKALNKVPKKLRLKILVLIKSSGWLKVKAVPKIAYSFKKTLHIDCQQNIKRADVIAVIVSGEEFVERRGPSPLTIKAEADLGTSLKKILHLHLLSRHVLISLKQVKLDFLL